MAIARKHGPDPKYPPRPTLPAGHKALNIKRLVAAALVELHGHLDAVEMGDEEARAAALVLAYSKLQDEVEEALDALRPAFTRKTAELFLRDRRERQELERRHKTRAWHSHVMRSEDANRRLGEGD